MTDFLPLVLFGLTILGTLISCGAAVISWVKASKPASVELQSTVDELVSLVEKMMKEQRKVKMSNVRSAAKDSPDPASDTRSTQESVSNGQVSKSELRMIARQKGFFK